MSLLETIGWMNEALKVCWTAALVAFIFCMVLDMIRNKESKYGSVVIGLLVITGGALSVIQFVVFFAYTGMGECALVFLVLPTGFVLTILGIIFSNSPEYVGQHLCQFGTLLVSAGLLTVFPYSVISLSHQAWHYYFI